MSLSTGRKTLSPTVGLVDHSAYLDGDFFLPVRGGPRGGPVHDALARLSRTRNALLQ
jgi:hypothetical protein